ncbi:MAG: hypothetical protein R3F60_04835 [bacterium]
MGEGFVPVNERVTYEAAGLHYQGIDGDRNPMRAVLVDLRDPDGSVGPGSYDLAGTNLADCEICVAGLTGCNPATGQCTKVFVPRAGTIEIEAIGSVNEQFTARLRGVDFVEVTVERGTNRSTPVPGGQTWCNAEQDIDVVVSPRPARIGEVVQDFALQNCETGEFVNVHALGADARALWLIGTAGWCPACREFPPQVVDVLGQIDAQLGAGAMQAMFILGEDASYGRPTVEYCRQYARRYMPDASSFYIDHNGEGSFATLFQYVWPYVGANGEFGLPWNALIRGGTFEYYYADRSGQSDLNTALNGILR